MERDADEISLNDEDDAPVEDQTCETVMHKSAGDEQSGKVVEGRESDPWSPQGKYTLLLETSKYHPVYYISDIAKLLDTGAIIRNSGRGCGEYRLGSTAADRFAFTYPVDFCIVHTCSRRCIKSIRRRSHQCKRYGL